MGTTQIPGHNHVVPLFGNGRWGCFNYSTFLFYYYYRPSSSSALTTLTTLWHLHVPCICSCAFRHLKWMAKSSNNYGTGASSPFNVSATHSQHPNSCIRRRPFTTGDLDKKRRHFWRCCSHSLAAHVPWPSLGEWMTVTVHGPSRLWLGGLKWTPTWVREEWGQERTGKWNVLI